MLSSTTRDSWTDYTDGTGAVTWTSFGQMNLTTGTTINSNAGIFTGPNVGLDPQQLNRIVSWRFQQGSNADVEIRLYTIYTGEATPPNDTCKHIGFKIIDGRIWATNGDGTTETATDTGVDLGAFAGTVLKVVGDGGSNIYYYVHDVLKATHTTNFPTAFNHFFWTGITNTAAANKLIRFYQVNNAAG